MGHRPRGGDTFCGGAIPFEAARLAWAAYGSDLNPAMVAMAWAALNIVGDGEDVAEAVRKAQQLVFNAANRHVEWGSEHNVQG